VYEILYEIYMTVESQHLHLKAKQHKFIKTFYFSKCVKV